MERTSLLVQRLGLVLVQWDGVQWQPVGGDVSEFRPERFLEKNEPTPFEFPTFHAGPRICIGRPLALVIQIKLVLSIILNSDLEFQDRC